VLLAVLVSIAPQTRLYRSFFLDELGQDYVRTARAKGLTENAVMFRHVLRNALIPILTNIGLLLPGVFTGAFLIEVFFSIPGIGREILLAVNRSDYPVIQAFAVYLRVITMLINLVVDLLFKLVDPRVVLEVSAAAVPVQAAAAAERSEGVWHAAWRRFRADRVGVVSACIVLAFLVLIAVATLGGVARNWQAEVGVANAPPTFMGPRAPEASGAIEVPKGPNADLSAVDPLAPRYAEIEEAARKYRTADTVKAQTLPFGADRLGRDVLSKAIKGTEISVFVGVLAALLATIIGTLLGRGVGLLRRRAGRPAGVARTTSSRRSRASCSSSPSPRCFGRGIGTVVLILGLTGWTGLYRQVRAEFMKHGGREYVRARRGHGRRRPGAACSGTSCPTSATSCSCAWACWWWASSRPRSS
jgi:peptide/nickel transport system permease protein